MVLSGGGVTKKLNPASLTLSLRVHGLVELFLLGVLLVQGVTVVLCNSPALASSKQCHLPLEV